MGRIFKEVHQFRPDKRNAVARVGGEECGLQLVHIDDLGRAYAGIAEEFVRSGIEVVSFGKQDEWLVLEGCETDGLVLGEICGGAGNGSCRQGFGAELGAVRELLRYGKDHSFFFQEAVLEAFPVIVVHSDDEIGIAVLQQCHQFGSIAFQDFHFAAVFRFFQELLDQGRQHIGTEKGRTSDGYGIAQGAELAAERRFQPFYLQGGLDVFQSCFGGNDRFHTSVEQGHSIILFLFFHNGAERRLGDEQFGSRFGKALFLVYFQDVGHRSLHVFSLVEFINFV